MIILLGPGPLRTNAPLEQWANNPNASLSHDERLLTRFRANTRATVIEIQRHLPDHQCVATDVFDTALGEFVVACPIYSQSPRFSRHLGWFTRFPHFTHPLGSTIELVPHIWFPWRAEVLGEFHDRQNADYSLTFHQFLREHFFSAVRLVGALDEDWDKARQSDPLDTDAHYSAVYTPSTSTSIKAIAMRFKNSEVCVACMVMPQHPSYGPCRGEFRFIVRGSAEELQTYRAYIGKEHDGAGERTIGMFSLYDKLLLFHCQCQPAFELGRRFLETGFADMLQFSYEDILDLGGYLQGQPPSFSVPPLPFATAERACGGSPGQPRTISNGPRLQYVPLNESLHRIVREQHAAAFADFLDTPHPFLDDRTPRESSRSGEGRKELVDLMKITLYEIDQRNREFHLTLNIDDILRELTLPELILSTPSKNPEQKSI